MATAGYSGTPLLKKMGIKPGTKLLLINTPADYFELLETDVSNQLCNKKGLPDLVHLFIKKKKEFETEMKKLKPVIDKNLNITIWVVKVCAVSEIWSGLKLVVPLEKRS